MNRNLEIIYNTIHSYCENGNYQSLKDILNDKNLEIDINYIGNYKGPILSYLFKNENYKQKYQNNSQILEIMEFILQKINHETINHKDPLYDICDPYYVSLYIYNPLITLCYNIKNFYTENSYELIDLLIKYGANIDLNIGGMNAISALLLKTIMHSNIHNTINYLIKKDVQLIINKLIIVRIINIILKCSECMKYFEYFIEILNKDKNNENKLVNFTNILFSLSNNECIFHKIYGENIINMIKIIIKNNINISIKNSENMTILDNIYMLSQTYSYKTSIKEYNKSCDELNDISRKISDNEKSSEDKINDDFIDDYKNYCYKTTNINYLTLIKLLVDYGLELSIPYMDNETSVADYIYKDYLNKDIFIDNDNNLYKIFIEINSNSKSASKR